MKKIIRFREEDLIPDTAKFILKERICIKNEIDHNCGCPGTLNCNCRIIVYEDIYFYEVYE